MRTTPASSPDPLEAARRAAEADVREALARDPRTSALAAVALDPIPGGINNWAWRATASSGECCFVRFAGPRGETLGADHANEARVLDLVTAAGLAPPIVRCDPAMRLLVTRWIEDTRPRMAPLRGQDIVRLARLLARLHRLTPPLPALRHVRFDEQARMLESQSRVPGDVDATLAEVGRAVFASLACDTAPRVVCHHDLNPFNLLLDATRRLWLVDWEYGGLGDPAIDVASFASQHGLDARARTGLLRAYIDGGGHPSVPGRLGRALWAFDYVQWRWYAAAAGPAVATAPPDAAGPAVRLRSSLRVRARNVLRLQ